MLRTGTCTEAWWIPPRLYAPLASRDGLMDKLIVAETNVFRVNPGSG